MRRAPRNPKTVPDEFDPMRWAIGGRSELPADGKRYQADGWCLPTVTSLKSLGVVAPEKRKLIRCPRCKRRFLVCAIHCVGGEFVCWAMPPHKTPPAKKPRPRRRARGGRIEARAR